MYGDGVYLTSLGPGNSTRDLLGNNWDGSTIPMGMAAKTEFYFEFDSSDDEDFEEISKKANRDIWILRGKDLKIGKQKAMKRKI